MKTFFLKVLKIIFKVFTELALIEIVPILALIVIILILSSGLTTFWNALLIAIIVAISSFVLVRLVKK
jgi:hypothetical protein